MKIHRKVQFIISAVLLSALVSAASAQWVRTDGPEGGRIRSLAMNDSIVIAGTENGGVFRSTDKGITWSTAGLGDATIECLCMQGDTVLAGGSYCNLFRSFDKGVTWKAVDSMEGVHALTVDGNTFYAGRSIRVSRSIDGGVHWTECAAFEDGAHGQISVLVAKDSVVVAGTAGGGFVSTDNGATWNRENLLSGAACIAKNGDTVYAGVSNNIIRSNDNGLHWASSGSRVPSPIVNSLIIAGNQLLAGTINGIFTSRIGDSVWTAVAPEFIDGVGVNTLAAVDGKILAGTSCCGIFRSTDFGGSWRTVNSGLINTGASTLAATGGTIFAAIFSPRNSGIYRSGDDGGHWSRSTSNIPFGRVHSILSNNGRMYAATDSGIYRFAESGEFWTECNSGIGRIEVHSMAVIGNRLFAGAYDKGLYSSTDSGAHWNKLDFVAGNGGVFSVAVCDNRLYASCRNHQGIQVSDDSGLNWTSVNTGLAVDEVDVFAVFGSTVFAGTHYGVYRKTDSGTGWQAINTGIDTSGLTSVNAIVVSGSTLFAAVYNKGVYMSTDNGTTWSGAGTGLGTKHVTSMAECCGTLFTGTLGCGIWKRPVAEMTGIQRRCVSSNYSRTMEPIIISSHDNGLPVTVAFTLTQPQPVDCSVYSLSGCRVSSLANGRLLPGEYRLSWKPRNNANGCYVVKIRAGTVSCNKIITVAR